MSNKPQPTDQLLLAIQRVAKTQEPETVTYASYGLAIQDRINYYSWRKQNITKMDSIFYQVKLANVVKGEDSFLVLYQQPSSLQKRSSEPEVAALLKAIDDASMPEPISMEVELGKEVPKEDEPFDITKMLKENDN